MAKASAVTKKRDIQLAPVPTYDEFWEVPIEKDPWSVPLEEKVELLRSVTSTLQKNPSVLFGVASVGFEHEWKFLATSEGSFIEQVFHFTNYDVDAIARTGSQVKTRNYGRLAAAGYEFLLKGNIPGNAERVGAVHADRPAAEPGDGRRRGLRQPGTALVPAMKIEDFRMLSISPAV